jgi:rod shape-determining protein MreD
VRAVRLGGALVAALALQTTLGAIVSGEQASVDLVLVLVVYVAIGTGPVAGLLFGSVAGLLQDVLSGGIVGVGGLAKSLAGFAAGVVGTQLIVTGPLPRFVTFVGATLLHAACFFGVYALIEPVGVGLPWAAAGTQAVVNGGAGLLAMHVVEHLPGWVRRYRMRRTHLRMR